MSVAPAIQNINKKIVKTKYIKKLLKLLEIQVRSGALTNSFLIYKTNASVND